MMDAFQAIFLGIIQGITEWLPISSSGHLVIFQEFLNIPASVSFDLLLHLGTLVVICFVFRKDIWNIIKAVLKRDFESEEGKWAYYIIIGSIPIFLAGLFFEPIIDLFFSSVLVAGIGWIITGIFLYFTKTIKNNLTVNKKSSINIGIVQAFALIPGVSRSGSTISMGIFSGVERDVAAKFSFLLSIPAILGAMVLKINDFSIDFVSIIGLLTSIIVGYLSLRLLLKIVRRGDLWKFSYYCFILGFSAIVLFSRI